MPVPPVSSIVISVDVPKSLEWGPSGIVVSLSRASHSTRHWVTSASFGTSRRLRSDPFPSICPGRVNWVFWPCGVFTLPSPCDSLGTMEGCLFNSFDVLVPGGIALCVVKLSSRFEDLVDLFDNLRGRDRSVRVILKDGLKAFDGRIFTDGIWLRECAS